MVVNHSVNISSFTSTHRRVSSSELPGCNCHGSMGRKLEPSKCCGEQLGYWWGEASHTSLSFISLLPGESPWYRDDPKVGDETCLGRLIWLILVFPIALQQGRLSYRGAKKMLLHQPWLLEWVHTGLLCLVHPNSLWKGTMMKWGVQKRRSKDASSRKWVSHTVLQWLIQSYD